MPRRTRQFRDGGTLHLTRRANNRARCFVDDFDRMAFLTMLGDLARELAIALHAYVLMDNHVHLVATPRKATDPSEFMHGLARGYAWYFNRRHERTGSLWEGRFWAAGLETDSYVLACHRYVELNPVRAGMVDRASDYRWSSHRANAGMDASELLTPHPSVAALGPTTQSVQRYYAGMFDEPLDDSVIASLRLGAVPGCNPVPNCSAARRA